MIFEKIYPDESIKHLVDCYWIVDSQGDKTISRQKIIPDGFPEIILHYGDSYKTNLFGDWQLQPKLLLAGQIRHHFHLENTGKSGMIGIKLRPTALSYLFNQDMAQLTNQIIPLPNYLSNVLAPLTNDLPNNATTTFELIDALFIEILKEKKPAPDNTNMVVNKILASNGMISKTVLASIAGCSERQLERRFKKHVGLSPKFYSRIIRFGYIFELMQAKDNSWADLVYESGFYDQSHFIKNFQEFTGEDPSSYGFDAQNMANFHLKKD